jgi:peptide deformylase
MIPALFSLVACGGAAAPTAPTAPANPIVQAGDPVLRGIAKPVDPREIATPAFQALVARMIAAMRAAPGVGLAAPQLGVPLRVIVLEDNAERMKALNPLEISERGRVAFGPRVFVNPVLHVAGSDEVGTDGGPTAKAIFFEGCLSVSGFAGLVRRFPEVEVSGLDEHGAPQTWRVRGWPARILQHEVDHLDGTLYVDRMETRSFTTQAHAKERFAGKPIAEILESLGISP